MGYLDVMKERMISSFKALGFSVRTMNQARKILPKPKNYIFVVFALLPIIAVIFISNPIFALTWLVLLFIYLPILDAYAYAVVYGSGG